MKEFTKLLLTAPFLVMFSTSSSKLNPPAEAAQLPATLLGGAGSSSQTSHRAADFLNALGVNVGMLAPDYRYNVNAVANDLAYTSFTHVRATLGAFTTPLPYYTSPTWVVPPSSGKVDTQGLTPITASQMAQLLAAVGARPDAMVYLKDPATYQSWLDANAGVLEYIEGPNEVDLYPSSVTYQGLGNVAAGAAAQQALYKMLKSDPKLAALPVYAMTIGRPGAGNLATAGDLSPYADFANAHVYAGNGQPPYQALKKGLVAASVVPGKPVVLTETGYPTAAYNTTIAKATGSGLNIVSENDQARYDLDAIFDAFNLGYAKTYLFMLIDFQCDPDDTNAEMHFGIFDCQNQPKPAAVALHNLHGILQDTGASASSFTPAPLSFALNQGLSDPVHNVNTFHTLLQKANGTYDLILWAEPTLWSYGRHRDFTVAAPVNPVQIQFSAPYKSIKIYDPISGAAPVQQLANVAQVSVSVIDHPVIVEIDPNQP